MWARAYGAFELSSARAITTNTTGLAGVTDLASYASLGKREMKVIVDVGAFTTTTTATVAITECATSTGTFAAPANGTTSLVTLTGTGVNELNFRADKRYIRAEVTVDTTGSILLSVVGIALKQEANS